MNASDAMGIGIVCTKTRSGVWQISPQTTATRVSANERSAGERHVESDHRKRKAQGENGVLVLS